MSRSPREEDDRTSMSRDAAFLVTEALITQQLEAILPRIGRLLAQVIRADVCGIFMYDDDLQRTVISVRTGYDDWRINTQIIPDDAAPRAVPIHWLVVESQAPVQRATAADYERIPLAGGVTITDDVLCDLAVPILYQGTVRGVAHFWRFGEVEPFNESEIDIAVDLAQIAAMAVLSAQGYVTEHAQRMQLDTLLEVARLSTSASTLDAVLPKLTEAIRTVTGVDVCQFYVHDLGGEGILTAYSDGLTPDERREFDWVKRFQVQDAPIERRIREHLRTEVVSDFAASFLPASAFADYAPGANITSVLVAPVVHQGDVVGSIYSWYREENRTFSDADIALVEAIARQAGGFIARARMRAQSEQHVRESEALLRIGEAVLQSESVEPVLDVIANSLQQLVPYDYAYIALYSDDRERATIVVDWGSYPGGLVGRQVLFDQTLLGHVLTTGELVSVDDVSVDSRAKPFDHSLPPMRGVLIVPLKTDAGTIGALYLGRLTAGAFSDGEQRTTGLLAQQAAFAVERIRSRNALADRARHQQFLANVVENLLSDRDMSLVLDEIAETGSGVIADGILIGLSSWQHGALDWVAHAHADPVQRRQLDRVLEDFAPRTDKDFIESLLHAQHSIAVRGRNAASELWRLLPGLDGDAIEEFIIVPMRRHERATGAIVLLTTDPAHRIPDDVLGIVSIVSGRIADAIERKQIRRNQEALLRVSEAMNSQTELAALLELLADELHAIVPFDQLYIGELEDAGHYLTTHLYRNVFGTLPRQIRMPLGVGIVGEAIETGVAIFDNAAHSRPTARYSSPAESDYYALHGESAMVAPLEGDSGIFGALFCGRTGANRFSETEFVSFLFFTRLAASAFQRTSLLQNKRMVYRASVEALAAVVDAKDPSTHAHSRNVARYARICAELFDLSVEEAEEIELAGLLHDIGKLSVPDQLLQKIDELSGDERTLLRDHPARGAQILARHPALTGLVDLVRHHHERYDGGGYPAGLHGEEIPLGAAIIAVANALDTMMSRRGGQLRQSLAGALNELERRAGTEFHPEVVSRFLDAVRQHVIPTSALMPESGR